MTLDKVKPYSKGSQRHQVFVNVVGEFICYGLQPICMADDPSFRKLMAQSDPKFRLPLRKYFSHHVIPSKYEAVKCRVENDLSKSKYCAMTTDLWMSIVLDVCDLSKFKYILCNDYRPTLFLHKPH